MIYGLEVVVSIMGEGGVLLFSREGALTNAFILLLCRTLDKLAHEIGWQFPMQLVWPERSNTMFGMRV